MRLAITHHALVRFVQRAYADDWDTGTVMRMMRQAVESGPMIFYNYGDCLVPLRCPWGNVMYLLIKAAEGPLDVPAVVTVITQWQFENGRREPSVTHTLEGGTRDSPRDL